jgi:hypothetical protein
MNFLLSKKTKPQFTLKSIENSTLFQRRVTNTNCHIDNHNFSRQMLINYTASHEDKHDKITHTTTPKSADNSRSPSSGTRFQIFSELGGAGNDMESQLGKAVTFEVNRGSVKVALSVSMAVTESFSL